MSTSDAKYTGSSVWNECFGNDGRTGKANTMLGKIRRQVRAFCAHLGNSDDEPDPEQFPLIRGLVARLNEQGGTAAEKRSRARSLQLDVETVYSHSKATLTEQLSIHMRKEGYTGLYEQLATEISQSGVEVDPDDLEVILDAHDLVGHPVETLIFVTGDLRHIIAVSHIICELTNICEVRSLVVYSPKVE